MNKPLKNSVIDQVHVSSSLLLIIEAKNKKESDIT